MEKLRDRCLLLDWGDTLMLDFPQFNGPMATWPQVEMVQGADEVLRKLRSTWRLVLATNAVDSSDVEIRKALSRVGLDVLIEEIYCFGRVGYRKPSPEFFAFILRDLRLKPDDVIMVGDSLENDVLGANRAGIHAVWLNHGSGERRGAMYRTIHKLSELPIALRDTNARMGMERLL